MNSSNKVQPVSVLQTQTQELIGQLESTQEAIMISVDGKVRAVMQDVASYEKTQEQLALLRILATGQQQIAAGQVRDHDTFFAALLAQDAGQPLAD